MNNYLILSSPLMLISTLVMSCFEGDITAKSTENNPLPLNERILKTDKEWKKLLTSEQFDVLRKKGTERAFTGSLLNNKKIGVYVCAACRNELFFSKTKFESGTGWPSFYEPISSQSVKETSDYSFGMTRQEIVCARCESHLGHLFPDGPEPTGFRYCINSLSLKFIER